MQTDRLEDQATAHLTQLREHNLNGQNGQYNKIVDPAVFQSRPLSPSHMSQTSKSAVAGSEVWKESTMRMGIAPLQVSARGVPGPPWESTTQIMPVGTLSEVATLPSLNGLPRTRSGQGVSSVLLPWFYRCWLICATVMLSLLLLWLQAALDRVPFHASILRTAVQWAELTWLAPVPLAIILWLGWFLFTEAVRPNPVPISVPRITGRQRVRSFMPAKPVKLIFRFVTRGDNVEVLRDSVVAVHQAFARYQQVSGPYQIDIVSERPVNLNMEVDTRTHIYVVPQDYVTQYRSRFKARALTYLQEQVWPQPEDWYIYLDEESLVDEKMLAGLYRFIQRSIKAETHAPRSMETSPRGYAAASPSEQAQQNGKKHRTAGLIGQGAILYQGGNWFFRGADALRTADDLGRFRLQYALGLPMFGIHGSYIVIRGIDDARLPFDVGSANSITEDAAWALKAWAQGFRFAWVEGYLHEQPPQRARDFVRQRSRWLSGIRVVLSDTKIPLPYRICLGIFTGLWQLAFLPFLIAVIAVFVHASPFPWMRLPADLAWATFTLAYLQGIDVQGKHSHPFLKKKRIELQLKRIISWLLVLCSIWYALLEAVGVIYSLRPKQGFFVIQKPSLAAENKVDISRIQPYQQYLNTATRERRL